ncbi:MAG: PBS lyase, partial [Candidatus Mariimomonas ferrooxydans]
DQTLRGYAAWALGEIRPPGAIYGLEKLRDDINTFTLYDEGKLKKTSVGKIASEALAKIRGKREY